jgi:multidrug efflux system outer membrane protein
MKGGLAAGLLAAALSTACTMGPNYHKPAVQIPAAYPGQTTKPQAQALPASFANLPWWQAFNDPQLQKLIRMALEQNYDLQLATERINGARAQLGLARSDQFPQGRVSGGFNGEKSAQLASTSNFLSLTSDVAFQLDFFGQLRRATEAARAQLLATEEARRTVVLTLVSDIASNYFQLLDLDFQLQITQETIKAQTESVKLTTLLLDKGAGSKLDVLQAQQVLDTANTQIPVLERQIGLVQDAMSLLIGSYPQPVPRGRPLLEQPLAPEVPPGMPSELLERRPDIRQAEQQLIAANAEIGVAKAQFFPQISLTGSGGGVLGRSSLFSGVMNSQTTIWGYGLNLAQPVFDGGHLRSNLRLAESQRQQALISYKQAIQRAFADVSDALIAYQKSHEVRRLQEQTVSHLKELVQLTIVRYQGGAASYLEVLDGQRSLFGAELTLAQMRGDEYLSLVQLYKALGGGWQP